MSENQMSNWIKSGGVNKIDMIERITHLQKLVLEQVVDDEKLCVFFRSDVNRLLQKCSYSGLANRSLSSTINYTE